MISPGLYKHYKGNLYQVLGISRHSETLEEMIIYQALYGDYALWVRPKALFMDKVLVDATLVPRFEFIANTWSKPATVR